MPDRFLTSQADALYPDDLQTLKTILDGLCRDLDILPNSDEARDIAADLVRTFQAGLIDEEALTATVRAHLDAKLNDAG